LITGFLLLAGVFNVCLYAEEIVILYTGDTHAMLYPCNCPKEPDGGVARRATLINQLRKNNPHTLLLDSGAFFAAGLMDQYTQNTKMDMERTRVNLRAIELMQYDALAVGDDEFNFGREFLEEAAASRKLPLISVNMQSRDILPYIIKEVGQVKFGIIGITPLFALQKAAGLKLAEPKVKVKQAIEELKKKGADIIVVLSHQGESDDINLVNSVYGIDILIIGHGRAKEEPTFKIGPVILLRPSWQGRKLGKLSLSVQNKRIINHRVEELRLSDRIQNDPAIISELPVCFSDPDCKSKDLIGKCQNPGMKDASCIFNKAPRVDVQVIKPQDCLSCDTDKIIQLLRTPFPGLSPAYISYPSPQANKLIKKLGIKILPAYILGKEVENQESFGGMADKLDKKDGYYILKPQLSGIVYYLDRAPVEGKLDLFISLYDKNSQRLLEVIKEFNPKVHLLVVEQADKFEAANGNMEVEDYLRAVCIKKYYPDSFWDYISCRAKNNDSSWWNECMGKIDADKIRLCAKGDEGKGLLRENISLNKELQIMYGPTMLLDNREIFGLRGVPNREDFIKILKRKKQ